MNQQSKNPRPDTLGGPEQGNTEAHPSGDPMPSAKTVEEADPGKPSVYPVQWEYHVLRLQDTAPRIPAHELDDLGREGWEMVVIFHLHATINFVFKRFVLRPPMPPAGAKMLEEMDEKEKKKLTEMEVE